MVDAQPDVHCLPDSDEALFAGGGVVGAHYCYASRLSANLDLAELKLYRQSEKVKRVVDLVLVAISSPLWVPLMAAFAGLVKLSDRQAPVLFRQARTGLYGSRFNILKFRTMAINAEEIKEQYRSHSTVPWPDFKMDDDPRITRIGKFLRKTSVDELPQIMNVIKGDMALIGPRPTSFKKDTYKLWQTERLDIRPGMTGRWQVDIRGDVNFDQRSRMDIRYLRQHCLQEDVSILLKTIKAMKSGQ